jgi:hypothetical protein
MPPRFPLNTDLTSGVNAPQVDQDVDNYRKKEAPENVNKKFLSN